MDLLKQMAEKQLGQKVQLEPLVGDGSDRIICRLRVEGQTIIGIYHENLEISIKAIFLIGWLKNINYNLYFLITDDYA